MSRRLTEEELLNELFEFEKSEAATIEQNGPGRWGFVGWNAPKDGKISRPIGWVPSREAWEKKSIEFHERQAEEAKKVFEESEERIRREKAHARRDEIENGAGADEGEPTSERESRSKPIELVIG